ncbi:MAG: preprotein translocase subunit SecE [Phycisphaeraceae bacterium]|nr:preprotein translocase subunit SecE [Phycisphaeraceae bacterium]
MNLRLYKPGQGYWMRVITAAFFGTLILAAAAWLWNESKAIALPTKGYVIPVEGVPEGVSLSTGETLTLLADNFESTGPARITIGTSTIASAETTSTGANIISTKVAVEAGREAFDASRFLITPASGTPYEVRLYGNMQPIPIFDPQYLQVGLAATTILIGAALLLYFVSANPRTGEFLIATDGEMKKVNWSTRKEVIGSTWVVVTTCFLLAGILFVVDFGLASFFDLIGIIDK